MSLSSSFSSPRVQLPSPERLNNGSSHRPLWPSTLCLALVLLLALVLRIAVGSLAAWHPERAISPDSQLYLDLARHFVAAFVEARADLLQASVWRTPGYPLFCAACFRMLGEDVVAVVAVQVLLSLGCVAAVYGLARQWFGTAAALWAALLMAFEPLSVVYAGSVRNETLFTLLVLLGVLAWRRSQQQPRWHTSLATGLLFALSVLVRPVTTYLWVLLLPADCWLRQRKGVVLTAWLAVGFVVPVAGWMARNHALTGQWLLCSIEGTNLLYYRAAGAVAEETGQQRSEVADQFKLSLDGQIREEMNPAERCAVEKSEAVGILLDHPYGALMSAVRGAGRLAFGPGAAAVSQLLYGKQSADWETALRWPLAGYLGLVYLAAAVGAVGLLRGRSYAVLALVGTVPFYLLLVSSGAEAYSRFRAPLMPFVCIVAGYGIARLVALRCRVFRGPVG